jgi:hypothetical protein
VSPKTYEDFELESGLPDDFDGAITDAYFGEAPGDYSKKLSPGTSADAGLYLVITDKDSDVGALKPQWFTCGSKGWEVKEGGKELVSSKRPDSKNFNMSSSGGILVKAMFETAGNGDLKKGQEFFIKRDRYMTQAEFYIGTNWHWMRVDRTLPDKTVSKILVPTKFLGEVRVSAGGKTVAPVTTVNTEDLDLIVIMAVGAKGTIAEKELKQDCMKDATLRANSDYMRALISGPKLQELVNSGKLIKSPKGEYSML